MTAPSAAERIATVRLLAAPAKLITLTNSAIYSANLSGKETEISSPNSPPYPHTRNRTTPTCRQEYRHRLRERGDGMWTKRIVRNARRGEGKLAALAQQRGRG